MRIRRGKDRDQSATPSTGLIAALEDARRLALEVAGLAPSPAVDLHALGVVLETGEAPSRVTTVWIHVQDADGWSSPLCCGALVTDRRVLLKQPDGALASLWWSSLVGLEIDLEHERVVLDYGDGRPRHLSGLGAARVAVMAVARVYGLDALLTHPGLAPVRDITNAATRA